MKKLIFDIDGGKIVTVISNNMAVDFEGGFMTRMSDNMAMDMQSGDIYNISSWSNDDDE
ncbi:MAG: hypothetical protein IJU78_05730 [Clostridia bacterium]|nr:hypothetical protein [Clostridia bacterium]